MKAKITNGQIKKYAKMPKYFAHFAGNFDTQPDEVHEKFGFYPVVVPEFNPALQAIGNIFFDKANKVFTYPVISKKFDLEELKSNHRQCVLDVIREVSQIASDIKNIYDPLRISPDSIPANFKNLVAQVLPLRQRAMQEIDQLKTVEEALEYVVRGPQVVGYIETMKTFL